MFTLVVACKFVQSASQTKYGAARGLAVEGFYNPLTLKGNWFGT